MTAFRYTGPRIRLMGFSIKDGATVTPPEEIAKYFRNHPGFEAIGDSPKKEDKPKSPKKSKKSTKLPVVEEETSKE